MMCALLQANNPVRSRAHDNASGTIASGLDMWHDAHGSSNAARFASHSAWEVQHDQQVSLEQARQVAVVKIHSWPIALLCCGAARTASLDKPDICKTWPCLHPLYSVIGHCKLLSMWLEGHAPQENVCKYISAGFGLLKASNPSLCKPVLPCSICVVMYTSSFGMSPGT